MSGNDASTRGTLFVVAAPSGAGKSSLVAELLAREPGISLSVSHATRAPRPDERDGEHYHFVSRATFREMIAADQFFEYAEVHGDLKGTSVTAVEPVLASGRDVLLEIDWQGAQQVREKIGDCCSIFILPPSRTELERRLRTRAADTPEAIGRRLQDSRTDIAHATDFDAVIVNDDFAQAVAALRRIVAAARAGDPLPQADHRELIRSLTET